MVKEKRVKSRMIEVKVTLGRRTYVLRFFVMRSLLYDVHIGQEGMTVLGYKITREVIGEVAAVQGIGIESGEINAEKRGSGENSSPPILVVVVESVMRWRG